MIHDDVLPSRDLISEQEYLVSRGVRPLAIIGHYAADARYLGRIERLLEAESGGVLPFAIDHGDGTASYGFAASEWVLDLYRWLVTDAHVPQKQRHRVVGLLLGYGVEAVTEYESQSPGLRQTVPI
jgi:hypothetical protein